MEIGCSDALDFFSRNGFGARTMEICHQFAHQQFPGCSITPAQPQGYCSYTLDIGDSLILQFRPSGFKLDLSISEQARAVYGRLVPGISYAGMIRGIPVDGSVDAVLHAYLQERIPGVPLSMFRERTRHRREQETRLYRLRLIQDIAGVFATGFMVQTTGQKDASEIACTRGYIGSSLNWRLNLLRGLQDKQVHRHVLQVQQGLSRIEQLPFCLTHGDMVPANIMVHSITGRLTGLIDWAEGEWLPFGVGLYGLEELLGEETPAQGFQYYPEHNELRHFFWKQFSQVSGLMSDNKVQLRDVALSRRLGVLLWRGLAFEDGRIDRLVEAGRDDVDICKLHMFLQVDDGIGISAGGKERKGLRLVDLIRDVWRYLGMVLWHRWLGRRRTNDTVSKVASVSS
jgi:hypothetical protein